MATPLLNDDGTASMATLMMSSHHAFLRDIRCFERALARFVPAQADALRGEWTYFRNSLHGHHTMEDTAIFPDLRTRHPELASDLATLDTHHRAIDPLLERGDELFGDLGANASEAHSVVRNIARLLDEHLAHEERVVIPHLRSAHDFPAPPNEEALAMYADGFAWSCAGIAPQVVTQIHALLPEALRERLPAARARFDARCTSVWGHTHTTASVTSSPPA